MRPLQVWFPFLGEVVGGGLGNPAIARDMHRAFAAWGDEDTVWLLPELNRREAQWIEQEDKSSHLAVPSERPDRLDVIHVGENGFVSQRTPRLPENRVEGLLDAWLNADRALSWVSGPQTLEFLCPRIDRFDGEHQRLIYGHRRIPVGPSAPLPVVEQPDSAERTLAWPPPGVSWSTVFPDAEAAERRDPAEPCVHSMVVWPRPLDALLPLGGGANALFAQSTMVNIARASATDSADALRAARSAAAPYLSEGTTRQGHTWFWPMMMQGGFDQVLATAPKFGLEDRQVINAEQTCDSPR